MKQLDRIENKLDKLLELNEPYLLEPSVLEVKTYDDNGLSKDSTEHGGLRVESVDKLLEQWRKKGGDHEIIANNQFEYYCFKQPHITYDKAVLQQIEMNQTSNWMTSEYSDNNIEQFYIMNPLYENKFNNDVLYRRMNPAEYMSGEWQKVQQRIASKVENHACVTNGNYSNPYHPKWGDELLDKILSWVSKKMEYELVHLNDVNPYIDR